MSYRSYISALLGTREVRALGNTFLYGTSYDLFNEYLSETSTAAIFARRMGLEFDGQKEVELYILLDFLTFIPFGSVGREYLRARGMCVEEHTYEYALLLLECAEVSMNEAEKESLRRFFALREDTVLPPDAVGVASAVRQLSDRLFDGITLGKCAGSLGKARALMLHLRTIAEEVSQKDLLKIDIGSFLSSLPALGGLNDAQREQLDALLA